MYFKNFPRRRYTFEEDNEKGLVRATDIFTRIAATKESLLNSSSYYPYTIKDGERPEHIADKLYDDSQKHWIVLFANQILDANYEWPLDTSSLEQTINKRFSSVNVGLSNVVSTFIVGETVYQGSEEINRAKTRAIIESINGNTLRIRSVEGPIANGYALIGATSNARGNVANTLWADNGFEWASNTISHYKATQIISNSVDNLEDKREWILAGNTFNHSTNTVSTIVTGTTTTTVGNITITTTIAPVTEYDNLVEQNDARREIVLFPKDVAERVEAEFKDKVRKL